MEIGFCNQVSDEVIWIRVDTSPVTGDPISGGSLNRDAHGRRMAM